MLPTEKPRVQAIDPRHSVWFSANAGAGKTYILVSRILRLLLAGQDPDSVLCLTFTRAACYEMKKRINDCLWRWGSENDTQKLTQELLNLLKREPTAAEMRRAQKLFYLCTGNQQVRIHTIHGFCEYLLRRFCDNLSFSHDFVVMDESEQNKLIEEVLQQLLCADYQKSQPVSWAVDTLLQSKSDWSRWQNWIYQFVNNKNEYMHKMRDWPLLSQYYKNLHDNWTGQIKELKKNKQQYKIIPSDPHIRKAVNKLWQSKIDKQTDMWIGNDRELCWQKLSWWDYSAFFVTQDAQKNLKPRVRLIPKSAQCTSEERELLEQERDRVYKAVQHLRAVVDDMQQLALQIIQRRAAVSYMRLKSRKNIVDYHDLISSVLQLLRLPNHMLHQYLRQNINHVLVDESQDNSITQWTLLRNLIRILFPEKAHRSKAQSRTIFITGDPKQSIYRFQGARLEELTPVKNYCQRRISNIGESWLDINVKENFRSNAYVLQFVDQVFARHKEDYFRNLKHETYRSDDGWVELWPVVTKCDVEAAMTENPSRKNQDIYSLFAEQVAEKISQMWQQKTYLPATGRFLQPGDVLILLRQRIGSVLPVLYKALQSKNIPIHNDNKLSLNKQLIIKDWLALLQFLLLPEDDLNTAKVAKSFLGCWNDDLLLYVQCHNELPRGNLWQKIQHIAAPAAVKKPNTFKIPFKSEQKPDREIDLTPVKKLVGLLQHLQKFYTGTHPSLDDLLQYIYHQVYPQIIRHFPEQAHQSVQTFLAIGKNYTLTHSGSLQDFVLWWQNRSSEGQNSSAGNTQAVPTGVHITTIHGAKGLEAPVVFLLDICRSLTAVDEDTEEETDQEAVAHMAEWWRLLYVAMTRAQDGLILAGCINKPKASLSNASGETWYDLLYGTMCKITGNDHSAGADSKILTYGKYPHKPQKNITETARESADLPTSHKRILPQKCWFDNIQAAIDQHIHNGLTTSADLILVEPVVSQNKYEGTLIHRILEFYWQTLEQSAHKPTPEIYGQYLKYIAPHLPAETQKQILTYVHNIIDSADWQRFTKQKDTKRYAEVKLSGCINHRIMQKAIDLLLVDDTTVTIIDYKYSAFTSQGAKKHMKQLQEYQQLIANIFPQRAISIYILWLKSAKLEAINIT